MDLGNATLSWYRLFVSPAHREVPKVDLGNATLSWYRLLISLHTCDVVRSSCLDAVECGVVSTCMRRICLAHAPSARQRLGLSILVLARRVPEFWGQGRVPAFWGRQSSGVLVAMAVGYVGVSKPKCRAIGWVAQNKRRGLWKSGFKSAKQAATWLAKQLGVRLSSLVRTACTKTPALAESRVHGVVAKKRPGGRVLWETRVEGQPRRSFASHADAVRVVARARRVNARSLAKKGPTRLHSRRQFQKAYRVFKKYVPGDLMHTRQQEVKCERQFKQELCHTCV